MQVQTRKLYIFTSALVFLAMIVGLSVPTFKAQATGSTVLVDLLQPSYGTPGDGGGGVYSGYYTGPYDSRSVVSPGITSLIDGREAGIIKAGFVTVEPWDEGLFGFKPTFTINTFASAPVTYDVETQSGVNPVWMTIEIDTGVVNDRLDNATYQFIPTSNPAGWHTVNAAAGNWQLMDDNGNGTGPLISLSAVATANSGLNVVRVFLRLGQGLSYYNSGTHTIAWVDKVTFSGVTYDFVQEKYWYVAPTGSDTLNKGSQASPFLTIQHAINSAAPGDTIQVAAGTYTENVVVSQSVTIAGAGAASTIVQPAVSNPNCGGAGGGSLCSGGSNIFLVAANNVVIHDLTAEGDNPALTSAINKGGANIDARNGIITDHNSGVFNGLEVYHVTVQNIYLRGMYASSGGTFNFHDNTVTNVQADPSSIAMFAYGGGPGTFANNTVSYANDAISANHSKGIQFLNNTVTHSQSGIHTDNSGDSGGVADLIQNNNIDCTGITGAYGIFVFVPYLAPTVTHNTITNCAMGLSAWGSGAPVTTQFTNNTLTGNLEAGGDGILVTTDMISWGYTDVYANFTGNLITGYETGILVYADPLFSSGWVSKTATADFSRNQIFGNTTGFDKGTTGSYAISILNNWWGDASGPSVAGGTGTGNKIVPSDIPFTPWCVELGCIDQVPTLPSHFYGYIHFFTNGPSAGAFLDAYVPGVTGSIASAQLIDVGSGVLGYQLDVPGDRDSSSVKDGGREADLVTFKIGTRIVATGTWHSGSNAEVDIHPPEPAAGPFTGIAASPITLTGAAHDWLTTDTFTYAWDLDGNGTYETATNPVDNTWADTGTKTIGLQVTDSQGGVGTGSVTIYVNPIPVTVNLSNLSQVYDGSPKPVTVATVPVGHTVAITYNGLSTIPTNAGNYDVLATVTDPNYAGSAAGTLVISPASSTVAVNCPLTAQPYTGAPILACTATATGANGLNVSLTVNYSNNVNVGTASASAIYAGDANHTGSSNSATFAISAASASITLGNLNPVGDGTPKSATYTTTPAGLSVSVTYNGLAAHPVDPGTYAVVAIITDPNYTGSAAATMYIQSTHAITLSSGWNLVSFNLHPMDTSIATVLNSLAGNYDLVYGWDATGAHNGSGNWMKYAPGSPTYANSLTSLDETMGFWIHMSSARTLNVVGNTPTSTAIDLRTTAGNWNLVGYPSLSSSADVATPLGSHVTLVYAYHASDTDLWKIYDPAAPVFANDLLNLSPGFGYWVKVPTAFVWNVNY